MTTKTREILIKESKGIFGILKDSEISKKDYNFEGLKALRQLLSNEKARIIHVIKTQKPKSVYNLAKKLNRDFKSVLEDVYLLKRFGFVELISEKTKDRTRYRPQISSDNIIIHIKI